MKTYRLTFNDDMTEYRITDPNNSDFFDCGSYLQKANMKDKQWVDAGMKAIREAMPKDCTHIDDEHIGLVPIKDYK